MPKRFLTLTLLVLGGWWLWKKSRASAPGPTAAPIDKSKLPEVQGISKKRAVVFDASAPPVFQGLNASVAAITIKPGVL